MLKKILAFVVMLYATMAFAAVDVNKATAAELDGIKGIGPAISGKIIDERKKGNFKDWGDFIERVKGVGEGNANKFSSQGLTVGGTAYKPAAAAPAAKTTDAKPVVAAASTPAADTKADAKAKVAADKQAKADEAKARKEAAKKAKNDAKMAKADAAKPAASAASAAKK
ncbi:MAG: helix-hairpin-helix domain-containing protein [Rhodoferax sp.]|nr:helix-hairpin-helix domain-containing protein [Rhodoferax sp.]